MTDETVRIRIADEQRKVLLVLEKGGKTLRADGEMFFKPCGWGLPGGRVKKGETPFEAAKRELWEETGLEADIEAGPCKITNNRGQKTYLFRAKNPRGKEKAGDDILDVRWKDERLIFGALLYKGKKFNIYETHIPLIHGNF